MLHSRALFRALPQNSRVFYFFHACQQRINVITLPVAIPINVAIIIIKPTSFIYYSLEVIMSEPVLMSPWIPVLAAFGGSAITGIINYLINLSNKKSEEKKHRSSLILQSAVENWKQHLDSAHKLAHPGKTIKTLPLDAYIIHMSKLISVLMDENISTENITNKILEFRKFVDKTNSVFEKLDDKN
jgi:hypothetical protein